MNSVAHRDYGFAGTAVDLHKYDDCRGHERAGCSPPDIDLDVAARLHVVLRNEVVFDAETLRWLGQYDGQGLSRDQRRLLAWGHSHGGAFTSRE